jgi:hypothetical protein
MLISNLYFQLQIVIVSDSPSSQYRNRFTLFLMNTLCNASSWEWEWIYSEAGHGKGAADGVGAAIKRQADAFVARGGCVRKSSDLIGLLSDSSVSFVSEVI